MSFTIARQNFSNFVRISLGSPRRRPSQSPPQPTDLSRNLTAERLGKSDALERLSTHETRMKFPCRLHFIIGLDPLF